MSDVTDADRERAEDAMAEFWVEFGSVSIAQCDELIPLLARHMANARIAAERAAVERVVRMLRERAYKLGAMAYSKPEMGVAAKAICDAIDLIQGTEREGAK